MVAAYFTISTAFGQTNGAAGASGAHGATGSTGAPAVSATDQNTILQALAAEQEATAKRLQDQTTFLSILQQDQAAERTAKAAYDALMGAAASEAKCGSGYTLQMMPGHTVACHPNPGARGATGASGAPK